MRIAIANDLPLAVEALRRVVRSPGPGGVPGHEVAWVARDGEEAVRMAAADRPDLILMDLVMPVLDGAAATRRIMAATPCPILVVTATVSGNYGLVYEALAAGAVDAVATPTFGPEGTPGTAHPLLAKIAQVARRVRPTVTPTPGEPPAFRPVPHGTHAALVLVGASTGGPQAIADLLRELPAGFGAAVVVVQHIAAEFAGGLADWLRPKCRLPVRLARVGDVPTAGEVLLAGRDDHLVLKRDGTLNYTAHPRDTPFRPNIDVLFESAAVAARPGVAVLLTGMGRDGADGLLRLRRAAWTTFAQSEATCAVYGMPDAAARLGAARYVLSPTEIGQQIAAHAPG